jgi:hypothetical protein
VIAPIKTAVASIPNFDFFMIVLLVEVKCDSGNRPLVFIG